MARRLRVPPLLEAPLILLARLAEGIVDSLAAAAYNVIRSIPAFEQLTEDEKKALAYAVVGDLIASPIPSPLDTPLDIAVQERIKQHMPETDKYRRIAAKIAESIPILELLPSYTITVLAAIREKEEVGR